MLENGHETVNFPDRTIFARMFNDNHQLAQSQVASPAQANEVATKAANFGLGYWCSFGPGWEKIWRHNEGHPPHQFEDKFALGMISGLIISKHPVFKCSDILQQGVLMKCKKRSACGTHFRKEPAYYLMLVTMVLVRRKLFVFRAEELDTEQDASSASYFHSRIESRKSNTHTQLAHREPQICAAVDHLVHHKPPICTVGDHVLPEEKREQVKGTPEPTQQELIMNASY